MKTSAYPTKATIARMIEAARASGLDVSTFEATRDGTIRIMDVRALQGDTNKLDRCLEAAIAPTSASAFDQWADQL